MQGNCSAKLTHAQAESDEYYGAEFLVRAIAKLQDLQREINTCATLMGAHNSIHCRLRGGCPWRCFEREASQKGGVA